MRSSVGASHQSVEFCIPRGLPDDGADGVARVERVEIVGDGQFPPKKFTTLIADKLQTLGPASTLNS
jgi:hypothetical protein